MLKSVDVKITSEGRDQGKLFRIKEMPAWQFERWGFRVLQALATGGVDLPQSVFRMGVVGLVGVNILKALSVIRPEDAFVLMDEMFLGIERVRDLGRADISSPLIDGDVEEVQTRLLLRDEWWRLHTGFSVAEKISQIWTSFSAATETSQDSKSTETSPTT
jgi:hypothetical protein